MPSCLAKCFRIFISGALLLLLLTTLVLGSGLAWLNYSKDSLRRTLEYGLSQWLQRELTIGELSEASLGLDSLVKARHVRLANPQWAPDTPFAAADYLELEINLPSLWRDGPVVIHHVHAQNLSLNLLSPEGHSPSWDFWPDTAQADSAQEAPFPVYIAYGDIGQANIIYRDPDQDLDLQLARARIAQPAGQTMLALELDGEINQRPLSVYGKAGPPSALFTGRDLQMDLELALGKLDLRSRGSIADLASMRGLALQLSATSPVSRPLLDILGMHEVRDGPLHIEAALTPKDPGLHFDIAGQLGEFQLSLKGSTDEPQTLDGINAAFTFAGPSLTEAGAMANVTDLPDVPYLLSGEILRQGRAFQLVDGKAEAGKAQLLVSGKLPAFPSLDDWQFDIQGSNLNLALLGPSLGIADIPETDYSLEGELKPSTQGIELIDLTLSNREASLKVNGVLGDGPDYFQTRLQAELKGDNIADMSPWLGLDKMPQQAFTLTGETAYQQTGWTLSNGRLQTESLEVGLDASTDRLIGASRMEGNVSLYSPQPLETLHAYGVDTDFRLNLPLSFRGDISGTPDAIELHRGQVSLGDHSATLDGYLGNMQSLAGIELRASLTGPDLLQLFPGETRLLEAHIPYDGHALLQLDADRITFSGLSLQLPEQQLQASGNANLHTGGPVNLDANLQIRGDSLHAIQKVLDGEPLFMDETLVLNTDVKASAETLVLSPLTLQLGQSDLRGSVMFSDGTRPRIEAIFQSDKLHLALLFPELADLNKEQLPEQEDSFDIDEYTDQLTAREQAERLIPDQRLKLDVLRSFDASLDYQLAQLYLHEDAHSKVEANFILEDGLLRSERLMWDGKFSQGNAVVSIDGGAKPYRLSLTAQGERLPLLWLMAGEPDNEGQSTYIGQLQSSGNTAREVAAALNGAIMFRDEGGRLDSYDMDLLLGDLLGEIIDRLNPSTEKSTQSEIECTAGAIHIRDGVVEVTPGLILRNPKLDFVTAGSINLNNETIDLAFSTRSRKGIGISAGRTLTSYVKLGGTLANPRLALNPKGAVVSSGAAIATAGWSILAESMWDRWVLTAGDACKRLLKKAREDKRRNYSELWQARENPS